MSKGGAESMSSSSSSPSALDTIKTPPNKHNFEEQLLRLRQQQKEQCQKLTQQYKEEQNMLHQKQQQELKHHYKRQMILNPNHKINPVQVPSKEMGVPPGGYGRYADEMARKHEFGDHRNMSMLVETPAAPSTSSNSVSALVRDRVRKKAIENITKKSTYESIDARSFPRSHEEFNRWAYESRAYPPPNGPDEDELIPLRKAASEPNLKGRNMLKHRIRYKPLIENPLMPPTQAHPRHFSPGTESRYSEVHLEKREALSPPYTKPIEGKVFSQGPKGVPPLFQSLPNININSVRSQMHFPSSMSTRSSFQNGSAPDLKAPLQPGHPKYLDMLKKQYSTNHRYLQHIMLQHGQDPKEIDLFHSKYLSKEEDAKLSDEERVTQLLESQNKLYLHLVDLFRLQPPYTSSMSRSLSKLHSVENISPPSSLIQSRSHDSLHNIKTSPRGRPDLHYKDEFLQPHGWNSYSHVRHSRDPYPPPSEMHFKDYQPTRLRLKVHLREKNPMNSVTLESHLRRLEREREHDHKIQEETEEDVKKEEQREPVSVEMTQESDYKIKENSRNSTEYNLPYDKRYNGSGTQLNGSNPYLYGSNSKLSNSNPRLIGSNPRLIGSNSRLHTSNPYLHGSDSRLYGSHLKLYGSDSKLRNSNPRLSDGDSKLSDSDPRIMSSFSSSVISRSTKHMTGIVYDTIMLKHQCSCGANYPDHPESPGRLQSIWARLHETGVANLCERIKPRKATPVELQTVHSEQHTLLFGGGSANRGSQNLRCFSKLACGGVGVDADTVWNETHTSNAARMAAGCVIELGFKVASGDLKNGFAIVRPPGHHAETHQAMGFCYFNSIAIAAKLLCVKTAAERVMIIDWDIHHGNGTQQMFYDDDRVLYLSIHRYDDGQFFPGTGKAEECGAGIGVGCNINVPFSGGLEPAYGDKEYLAAFRTMVIPVLKEYKPDIILVSAGFDAAAGHTKELGGYNVSAACFAYMTKQLMEHVNGRVVLALEGGYALQSLCDCTENCIRALLGGPFAELSDEIKEGKPHENAVKSLERVAEVQGKYWTGVKRASAQISCSFNDAKKMEKEEADTVNALASLSMHVVQQNGGMTEQNGLTSREQPSENVDTEEPMEEN